MYNVIFCKQLFQDFRKRELILALVFILGGCVSQTGSGESLCVTRSGSKYHLCTCQYASKTGHSLSLDDAVRGGYEPCRVCKPPVGSPVQGLFESDVLKAKEQDTTSKGYNTRHDVKSKAQCLGTTKSGRRCKRKAKDQSGYCWQHKAR